MQSVLNQNTKNARQEVNNKYMSQMCERESEGIFGYDEEYSVKPCRLLKKSLRKHKLDLRGVCVSAYVCVCVCVCVCECLCACLPMLWVCK